MLVANARCTVALASKSFQSRLFLAFESSWELNLGFAFEFCKYMSSMFILVNLVNIPVLFISIMELKRNTLHCAALYMQ